MLVGEASVYRSLDLPSLSDLPPGIGPLGGLAALIQHAAEQHAQAICLACDMPYVSAALLHRLAHEAPQASALAPRDARGYQPFFARYDSEATLPVVKQRIAEKRHSLQRVLSSLDTEELCLSDDEAQELRDWDRPEDIDT